ncbi:TnsA endonuclease N-terminal domain-containing protein, partial [Octadecabacter ascidiaceicola]|uniref:TnsA endonuclease N-terminal domain-containing protein n=1 Tax=Octadecabacter ascidiaceicola TaxID=1655543 RepID=UPI00117C85A4
MMSSPTDDLMVKEQPSRTSKPELCARQSYVDCFQGVVKIPLESAGTRKLSKRSRQSSRGGIPFFSQKLKKYITLKTESHLEGAGLFVAMADPEVVHIWDQPSSVTYTCEDGREVAYTADALIEYRSGFRVLLETKPFAIAQRRNTELKLKYIAQFVPPEFANQISLFTEKSCPKWFVADARRLHEFSKHPDASLIEADANKQNSTPKEDWERSAIDPNDAPRAVKEYLDVL